MIIIYRKSDLQCVGTVVDDSLIDIEIELNVIPNYEGEMEDYNSIEIGDVEFENCFSTGFHLENINNKITIIPNSIIETPQLPSLEDRIKAVENALLNLL